MNGYYMANRRVISRRAAAYFGRCVCGEPRGTTHREPVLFTDAMDRMALAYLRLVL